MSMTTNWDKALTYVTTIESVEEHYGTEKLDTLLNLLLKAGGTFAVSQGKIYTSDFSTLVLKQTLTDWTNEAEKSDK